MAVSYTPVHHGKLAPHARYCRPFDALQDTVTRDSPALSVMTDLLQVSAVTIGPGASIDVANQRMIAASVRLLLVVDAKGCVLGLITATDILGEQPLQHLRLQGGAYGDILVSDIMTAQEALDVLLYKDVELARVGDIVETLKRFRRQHALVVDQDARGQQRVRGIFSSTQIGRQLGITITPAEKAETFAELEAAIVS